MYVQPTNYTQNPKTQTPKPQTPYGQIIIVNKIYYSYLHVKSGAVCPQAIVQCMYGIGFEAHQINFHSAMLQSK